MKVVVSVLHKKYTNTPNTPFFQTFLPL